MSTAVATIPNKNLVSKVAARFGVDADKMLATLKATAFRQRKQDVVITNEQMMALLIVADQYGLNPFTKEIFAFEDKGAIIPVVSVDGWTRIINESPHLDGIEFRYSEAFVTDHGGKPCPEWCEAVIYRDDRTRPIIVREYLDEVYVPERNNYRGPWQTHTKRMLRHKALIQGSRVAFGFAGIYDEDEAHRIIEGEAREIVPEPRKVIEGDGAGQEAATLAAAAAAAAEKAGKSKAPKAAPPAADPDPVEPDAPEPAESAGAGDGGFSLE